MEVVDGISITPKQAWAAAQCTRRVNIYEGSIRSGKTMGSLFPWIRFIRDAPSGDLFMIGKTLETLERNVLRTLQDMLGRRDFHYKVGAKRGWMWGRRIDLLSAYDRSSYAKIRGSTCAGWLGDELTLWPENFFKELLQRMSPPGAKGIGTTNPDSPFHWLKTDFLDRIRELQWRRFKFMLKDNTFLTDAYIEALERENEGLYYQRLILGLWVLAAGTVYSMFNEDKHLTDAPQNFPFYGIAVDYGTTNPTVFGLFGWGLGDGKVYLLDLYYYDSRETGRSKTDEQYANDFEDFTRGIKPKAIVVDPSAKSFITELQGRGMRVRPARNDVTNGIRFVSAMLTREKFLLNRTPAVRPAVKEFGSYVWDESAQERGEDKPLKKHDHAMDMIRYFLFTLFHRPGTQPEDITSGVSTAVAP